MVACPRADLQLRSRMHEWVTIGQVANAVRDVPQYGAAVKTARVSCGIGRNLAYSVRSCWHYAYEAIPVFAPEGNRGLIV